MIHIDTFIHNWMNEKIPLEEQDRFMNMILEELNDLHKGNIARFRVRPSEFEAWKAG